MINEQIVSDQVMLVGKEGKQVVKLADALRAAQDDGMDLVQVSTADDMPVCKVMNYSKYLYDQKKRDKHNNKDRQELKEVRMNDGIAENDLKIKAKTVDRILGEGDKVKVSIVYKGRLQTFITRGLDKLTKFETFITHLHTVDMQPKIEGNRVIMVVSPRK